MRPSITRKFTAAAAVMVVVTTASLGVVASHRTAPVPVRRAAAGTTGAFQNGWSTRTGGNITARLEFRQAPGSPAGTAGAHENGWSTRSGGNIAAHPVLEAPSGPVGDTSGAYENGWSTRTGGNRASAMWRPSHA
jgi:hypothetical protein